MRPAILAAWIGVIVVGCLGVALVYRALRGL